MKIFFIILTLISFLNAKSYLLSSLSIPGSEVIDLSTKPCSEECLNLHLIRGEVFSFLAKFNKSVYNSELKNRFLMYSSILNLKKELMLDIEIAILFPQKKIGKYVLSTTKSILAYLLSQDRGFRVETFDCIDESEINIKNAIDEIRERKLKYVIAIFTGEGLNTLEKYSDGLTIFVPTINKNTTDVNSPNIIFGGIDYKAQIAKLKEFTNSKTSIFYDKSVVSKRLTKYIEANTTNVYKKEINTDEQDFKKLIRYNKNLNYSSIFLNTPVITSSLIMSQLVYYEKPIHRILSTQVNYNPILLSLTQKRDRSKLLIVNSISKISNAMLNDYNKLLANDISYDWINYTTTVGVDYLFNLITKENNRYFGENIFNNQMIYNLDVVKIEDDRFKSIIY